MVMIKTIFTPQIIRPEVVLHSDDTNDALKANDDRTCKNVDINMSPCHLREICSQQNRP